MFEQGWKSIAGLGLIIVGTVLNYVGMPELGQTLINAGEILLGIGLTHKAIKIQKRL